MQKLKTFRDSDIFLDAHNLNSNARDAEYKDRPTVKVILTDSNDKICVLKVREHYLLPGGGVEKVLKNTINSCIEIVDEEYEDLQVALRREIMEEVGCEIKDIKEIGIVEQYRNYLQDVEKSKYIKYIVYFYTAKIDGGKGKPTTTQADELKRIEICWLSKEEVLKIFEDQNSVVDENEYAFCFNTRSHYEALKIVV